MSDTSLLDEQRLTKIVEKSSISEKNKKLISMESLDNNEWVNKLSNTTSIIDPLMPGKLN